MNKPTDQDSLEVQETAEEAQASGQAYDDNDEVRVTDIVFDCPHCRHNLAIDYRGAGNG